MNAIEQNSSEKMASINEAFEPMPNGSGKFAERTAKFNVFSNPWAKKSEPIITLIAKRKSEEP